jgi:hypothetical protein
MPHRSPYLFRRASLPRIIDGLRLTAWTYGVDLRRGLTAWTYGVDLRRGLTA